MSPTKYPKVRVRPRELARLLRLKKRMEARSIWVVIRTLLDAFEARSK